MANEIQVTIVVYPHRGFFFYRIEADGRTVEDCNEGFNTPENAVTHAYKGPYGPWNRKLNNFS